MTANAEKACFAFSSMTSHTDVSRKRESESIISPGKCIGLIYQVYGDYLPIVTTEYTEYNEASH